ncbi:MAG: response regulator transcription factor [Nitrospinae bacterium]|nr:response regulator transcription factor [Nitrospinota bacterium]
MTKNNIKIIIAEDHSVVRRGINDIISEINDFTVVNEASNGDELLEILKNTEADMILLDIGMPQRSGWDVMMHIRMEKPNLKVLVLSVYPENEYALQFIKAGASGYVCKASASDELVQALRTVASGKKYFGPSLTEQLAKQLTQGDEAEQLPHESLSPRELQILCLIASGKTVREIAEELFLSIPTVNTHRARILTKMNLKNNVQIAHYAFVNKLYI